MRQCFVGNSGTSGARVAVARGGSAVGSCERDSVLDGAGGVEGAEAEHPVVTTRVTTANRPSNPRLKLTQTH